MASSKCKIEVPNQLPESGVSRVQFKSWKEGMIVYLKQNDDFLHFLPGGAYEKWRPEEEFPNRIDQLEVNETLADDPTTAATEGNYSQRDREISALCSA